MRACSASLALAGLGLVLIVGCGDGSNEPSSPGEVGRAASSASYVVLAYNDLGMHCLNKDFSNFMVLPPYNTMHATVIKRGKEEPDIVKSGVTLSYSIPGNTRSSTKTNFWTYAPKLLGVSLKPDIGLTGNGLSGVFKPTGQGDFAVTGIPITPTLDNGAEDSYPLAKVTLSISGKAVATVQPVVPNSWEMSCNLCHTSPGRTVDQDILADHDRLHGTKLLDSRPVTCGKCHAQAPLGLAGLPGLPSLSAAMHRAHAPRMAAAKLANECYACHPGVTVKCQRDLHSTLGMDCRDCHESMQAVANPGRRPWVDEPRCGECHHRSGFEFEEPGKLFRESRGHHGVPCAGCHGSPHAMWPSTNPRDNVLPIALQGVAAPIGTKCSVCHAKRPEHAFDHRRDDD